MEKLKFIWERIKARGLAHSIILIILVIIWLPTLTPDDFITIPFLIALFGFKVYITVALIIIAVSLVYFNGKLDKLKSLLKRPRKKEIKKICKKMHKNETAINKCIKKNVLRNFDK